jgi:hypothetical protein
VYHVLLYMTHNMWIHPYIFGVIYMTDTQA